MCRLRIIATALLALAPLAGAAQEYGLTDQQRRRVHLPYVRAATECLARVIASSQEALDLARTGRWHDAISAVPGVCRVEVGDMVRAHDRLYGPGTGDNFLKGAYLDDLPRALSTRLKSALQQPAVNPRDLIDGRLADYLTAPVLDCALGLIVDMAETTESADAIASAVGSLCSNKVDEAIASGVNLLRANGQILPGSPLDGVRDELRSTIHKRLLMHAVLTRTALRKGKTDGRATEEPASATQPVAPERLTIRKPEECLKEVSSLREGRIVDQENLISTMLDLCRPEIENAARSAFLADPSTPLEEARTSAAAQALASAKRIVGVP